MNFSVNRLKWRAMSAPMGVTRGPPNKRIELSRKSIFEVLRDEREALWRVTFVLP